MALHPNFPQSPHDILDPTVRWFPADEALRESRMDRLMPPLVAQLRRKVKEFRDSGYVGASDTSKSLLHWWFVEPHLLPQADGRMHTFAYYFAQREAIETIIYLSDVVGVQNESDLMRFDASGAVSASMFDEYWRRYVIKMATGSGKTKVLSLALAWSFYHKCYEPDSTLARNFLLITPNIIVLDRIYKDFQGLRIFFEDPVLPDNGYDGRNWRDDFQLTLHVQDEVRVMRNTGNIFLTNIHRVYSGDDIPPSPDDDNTMDYFLGKRPTGKTTDSKVDLSMIVRDIDELMVLNDEAHHIHDKRMAWFKSIEDIHNRLVQKGGELSLQLDVSATPKHNNGSIFVQTIADYPLVEAISQNVVKHPVLPDAESREKLVEQQSAKFTEKYADYLELGVRAINELTVSENTEADIRDWIKLRQTRPFVVKDQGYLLPSKSLFNRIIGDSHFELAFADFLEGCRDVVAYAKNYLAIHFKLDYINVDGDISNYYPDFIVKLTNGDIVIVETKGVEDLDVPHKLARLRQWCTDVNSVQTEAIYDFVFVDDDGFDTYRPKSFGDLRQAFTAYQE
ncbi:MAG: DEAD/DEAH box helicase family protein [Chloroflexota bacterium]